MYLFVCLDKCIYVYTHKQRIQVLSFEQTFRSTAFFSCSQEKGERERTSCERSDWEAAELNKKGDDLATLGRQTACLFVGK